MFFIIKYVQNNELIKIDINNNVALIIIIIYSINTKTSYDLLLKGFSIINLI